MSAIERNIAPAPTPCIDVCTLDEASGLCLGCARTGDEIAVWQQASPELKRAVWNALPARRDRLRMRVHRLPWTMEESARFIQEALRGRAGRWRLGIHGAEAIFAPRCNEKVEITQDAASVTAVTPNGALRLLQYEKTIAIAFSDGDEGAPEAIGFVLPRGRVKLPKAASFKPVGPDSAAILREHRGDGLYDLGIGPDLATRICLRTGDPAFAAQLDAAEGQPWPQALAAAGPWGNDYHIVIETGLGRAEIFAPPLLTGTQANSYADLNSGRLGLPRELPPVWELKPVFALGALFYPDSRPPVDGQA